MEHDDSKRPGGTQVQVPFDETSTFVDTLLSISLSALQSHTHTHVHGQSSSRYVVLPGAV